MKPRGSRDSHRTLTAPSKVGTHDGLAFATFAAQGSPRGRIVVLHGSGSRKESHFDFARAAAAAGFNVATFDQRGHGGSSGHFGANLSADIGAVGELIDGGPLVLRGSSMGGYLALVCARELEAAAVVAICPASAGALRQGLLSGRFTFGADRDALLHFLHGRDAKAAAAAVEIPILLMHAQGDEQVEVEHSRELIQVARSPLSRLVEIPGGHHRSVQHDPELQGESLRFLTSALRDGGDRSHR